MRDDASLRRLEAMGIEAYRLRRGRPPCADAAAAADAIASPDDEARDVATSASVRALLLVEDARSRLIADVSRSLAWLRVAARACAPTDPEVETADVLVAFGDACVRTAGARLPAQRQQAITWIAAPSPEALAGDSAARRALWSELRRLARTNGG